MQLYPWKRLGSMQNREFFCIMTAFRKSLMRTVNGQEKCERNAHTFFVRNNILQDLLQNAEPGPPISGFHHHSAKKEEKTYLL